jgi:hypothetical protein
MLITLKINDDVPNDEVAHILRRLAHDIDITDFPPSYCGKKRSGVRVFDSNGDLVGGVEIKIPYDPHKSNPLRVVNGKLVGVGGLYRR